MFRNWSTGLLIIIFAFLSSGCVALLAGAVGAGGTAIWLKGELVQEINAPFDRTVKASKSALKSLKLEIVKETKKLDLVKLESKYFDGKMVWIDIHKTSLSKCRLEIRVGVIGDETATRKIADEILKKL